MLQNSGVSPDVDILSSNGLSRNSREEQPLYTKPYEAIQTELVCDVTDNGSCRVVCEWGSRRTGEGGRCRRLTVH